MSEKSDIKILQDLMRYRISRKIGAGGMATVYLARDGVLNRDVALKIMHEHLISSSESIRRFKSEARAVASLSHENIVKIFDYGELESRPYIVMEHIEGPSLISLIEKHGSIPNLVALEIARQILLGLSCAHGHGIIHRDIKPDNIMIDANGVVKIMDFGIAYIVNRESITMTGSFLGSPRYISPEQAEGRPLTGTTDIFSLGVLLYIAICGRLPFDAEVPAAIVHAIIHDPAPSLIKQQRKVLFWLSDFVADCFIKDPLRRPDAEAALTRIEKECLLHELKIRKELLTTYFGDTAGYTSYEEKNLFEHFRGRAREAVKRRRIPAAIRDLEQAAAFGSLAEDDEKIITRYLLRRRVGRLAAALLLFALCSAGLYGLFRWIPPIWKQTGPAAAAIMTVQERPPAMNLPGPAQTPRVQAREIKQKPKTVPERPVQNRPVAVVTPQPVAAGLSGFLSVRTNPPWAKIYIDDIERGTTPATTVFPAGAGQHRLRIVKDGFAEYVQNFSLAGTDTLTLKIHLEVRPQPKQ